jgi:lysophospholipase L1-like esterase
MRTLLVVLALALAAPAGARPVRVCVIGDSISEGFSPATRGWSSYLVQSHSGEDFSAKNVSQSGDKVAAGRLVFDREAAGVRFRGCTHVAILLGTNDLPDGTSAATIYATINGMCTQAEQAGARCVLLALLPRGTGASWSTDLGTRLLALNALMAARSGSIYVDTYNALLEPASSPPALAAAAGGATDGLHPNNTGEALIASTVNAAVVSAGGW